MRFSLLTDGSVHLSQVNEWELRTLRSLPGIADPGDDEASLRRLYPAPFVAGEATEEQQEDWAEFVQPDLEQLFETSLERVAADVKKANLQPPSTVESGMDDTEPDEDDSEEPSPVDEEAAAALHWEFTIPVAHVEDWYRAMNQARLMLSERHEAHRSDDEHIAKLFMTGHMETLIQYELLTALCGWWVEVLMKQ